MLVLGSSGLETDAVLRTKDTVTDLVSGATDEVTNTGYARKTLTDADLSALSVDDVNHRVNIDMPDQTFNTVAAGSNWGKVVIAYDPDTTSGTDANLVPLTAHDATFTPNGTNITVTINSSGFFRAQG